MKIALLGNMNNNNVALMRYFRDLGADAHVLLWSNDGTGTLSHFVPENDTWEIEKWGAWIHRTEFPNSYTSVIGVLKEGRLPPSSRKIRDALKDYDVLIGSGISAALVARAGRKLDIFYPYALGVEYVDERLFLADIKKSGVIRKALLRHCRNKQIQGIREARYCLNAEMGATAEALRTIGRDALPYPIPMVYVEPSPELSRIPGPIKEMLQRIRASAFTCFSHARQSWVRDERIPLEDWERENKHTDWLIRGFSEFMKREEARDSLLVLLEYGPDVEPTRKLIRELGIEGNVLRLPKMSRKELMLLLGACDLGVGEFIQDRGTIWGGTGWEVLASGKPLMQTFNFTPEGFEENFGYPPPPMLDVKSAEDVTRHLQAMRGDAVRAREIGKAGQEWFHRHNGRGLAQKWLDLLNERSRNA